MKKGLAGTALVLMAAVLVAGCAVLEPRPTAEEIEAAARAREVLFRLENQNNGLKNFKGIGRIRIRHRGQLELNERLAWIGSRPDRLSIVVLVSGFATLKIATDGKWFYYYEARSNPPVYKKFRAGNASLKRLLAVEIKVSDILTLLAGRVPLRDHDQALLAGDSFAGEGVLVLKKRWGGTVEKIYLDEGQWRVRHVEFFNGSGKRTYRVRFEDIYVHNGYELPGRLEISNDDGTEVALEIFRLLTDVDVADAMFIIAPPD